MLAVIPVALIDGARFNRLIINPHHFFRMVVQVVNNGRLGEAKIITSDEG